MEADDITRLLEAARDGRPEALDDVFEAVYPHLRAIAHARRRGWKGAETLNTTGLIHEAYLKVASGESPRFTSRAHFFATAARAMRQVLINYAERQRAAKRGGGGAAVTLDERDAAVGEAMEEMLALDDALRGLEELSVRQARVVECLFFAGLNVAETAEALDISPATVKRDWATARAWLFRRMREDRTG